MKQIVFVLTLLTGLSLAQAQERVPAELVQRLAKLVSTDTKQLQGTPIPTSVDIEKAVAMRDGEMGGMVLPEAKLSAETLAKAGEKVVPIGQLWLHRLTPVVGGEAIESSKLRMATVKTKDGEEVKAPQCALGVQKNSAGNLELLIYGKDKEPLLKVAMTKIDKKQEAPIEVDADRGSAAAEVTLKILGKYEAKFKVTELES